MTLPKVKNVSPFDRYDKAATVAKHRIIAASYGEAGSGKSTWWLGAPGPIVIQTLDQGLEGVVETFAAAGKEIYVANYDLGKTPGSEFTVQMAQEAVAKFIEDFEHAVQHARTVVWDRETDLWNLFFFAEFGTDDAFGAAPPKDWDRLKGKIRRLIAMAKATDVNFGLIQGMKNEWGSKVNPKTGAKAMAGTGNRIRSGMDDVESLVHVNIEHTRIPASGGNPSSFAITVGKSRGPGSRDVQDQTFEALDFASFAQIVFPDSDPAEWL